MQHPNTGANAVRSVADFARTECRESTRFRKEPGTDFALFWQTGGTPVLASVHDESLTGICLVLSNSENLAKGMNVFLAYQGQSLQGEVRHVTPTASQTVHVGIETHPMPTEN